ncbi:MAG TPA: pyridoxamine 5'-phosphate oxidase family protein, partial [Streptomyces sp.]|nr:pyridoxamine 5'-phosphate oxidase family protein [Streptomyces sp.]
LLDAHAPADLLRAAESGVIAFETGEIDQLDGKGWSVTVLGHAKVITRMEGLMPARGPAAPADVEPARRTVIRLHPELVTGRSIGVSPRSC